ncbi:MAG: glycosyltransferase [Endomicrobium sp.]|nr:glycosyltransferase [Endomicrobium sp.]
MKGCIESIKWAGEIIIVDDFSVDAAVEIAEKIGYKAVQNKFEYFGKQRNLLCHNALCKWVICLDTDERITPVLREEIECKLKNSPKGDTFAAPKKSRFINK